MNFHLKKGTFSDCHKSLVFNSYIILHCPEAEKDNSFIDTVVTQLYYSIMGSLESTSTFHSKNTFFYSTFIDAEP